MNSRRLAPMTEYMDVFFNPVTLFFCLFKELRDTRVTSGVLPFALRAAVTNYVL